MLQALHAEWQKARRRHDLVLCLTFAVILYLWLGSTAPTGQDELANAYSALFFGAPIINTILLPVLMAVLASRLWDVEVKGYTAKLLYTLQSRRSLFFGKAVFGLGEIVLMVALEAAVLLLLGHTQGYTEAFPAGQFAYLNLCTLTVCTMLYFSELLLALWFSNPLPAVCVGIIGALLGLCPGATLCRCAATRSRSGTRPATPYFTARGPATGGCWYLPLGWRSLCLAFAGA